MTPDREYIRALNIERLREPEPAETDSQWHCDHHNFEQHFHQYATDLKRGAPSAALFYPSRPVPPIEEIPAEPVQPVEPIPILPILPTEPVPVVPVQPVRPVLPAEPVPAVPVQPILPIETPPAQPVQPPAQPAWPPYCRPPFVPGAVFPGYSRNLPPGIVARMQEVLDDLKSLRDRLNYLSRQARYHALRADFGRLADIKDRDAAHTETFFRDVTGLRSLDYTPEEYRGVPGEVLLRRAALDQRALIGKLNELNRWFARTYAAGRLDGVIAREKAAAEELERLIR
jgi:hypothetical protein